MTERTEQWPAQQQKPCTYNVTLRRVRATIVAVEKAVSQYTTWVCVCSLRYL